MASKKASAKSARNLAKKKSIKPTVKKLPVVKDPLTKGGIIRALVDMTALNKKSVVEIMDSLTSIIELHVKSRGPGKFTLPGLLKISVVKRPAKPARKGINPFTGEETMFKAKPAHKVVKVKALRKLKAMAD